jgi:hypothetical protein
MLDSANTSPKFLAIYRFLSIVFLLLGSGVCSGTAIFIVARDSAIFVGADTLQIVRENERPSITARCL